jgi:phage terminase large subunit-like protein
MGNVISYAEMETLKLALEEQQRRKEFGGHLQQWFLDEGPFRYTAYPKHVEFFKQGAVNNERLFMAANRVGKSIGGAYEATCHLTGLYPHWWEGKRFNGPTEGWAAGDTGQTTRDILQDVLLGFPTGVLGTGMIPGDLITQVRRRSGIADAIDTVKVRHVTGGTSILGFKSYDQGRRSFQGTGKDFIWLDEECPQDVYGECIIRTMTTSGVVYVTFTPLSGQTKFIQDFLKMATLESINADIS